MPDRDEAELLTKMVLRLHATNLPRNGIRKTFPDTYAIVTSLEGEKEDGSLVMREHGRTEV